ncbi:iron ABC transporter permease, partial [Staphylococcus sp. SIMBA_130]
MHKRRENRRFIRIFLLGIVFTIFIMYMSLATGIFDLTHLEIIQTLLGLDALWENHLVIYEFRLPRIVIGAFV